LVREKSDVGVLLVRVAAVGFVALDDVTDARHPPTLRIRQDIGLSVEMASIGSQSHRATD
jgi:hypothetical protein